MPCVCQGECRTFLKRWHEQPYRSGQLYCAVCKVFSEPTENGRCICCNGLLRTKTKSKSPDKRKRGNYR